MTKRFLWRGFQVARVGLIAYVVGVFLAGAVDRMQVYNPVQAPIRTAPAAVPSGAQPTQVPREGNGAGAPTAPTENFTPARVVTDAPSTVRGMPSSGQWMWWTPTIFVLAAAVLFGTALAIHNERQVVRDSPEFARALRAVKPLITTGNPTPRAIKRYQNRMRYLAARLRPPMHEPDALDSLLNWFGLKTGRQIVPPAWFAERPRQSISEPALILLGAIELYAPKAFSNPAKLYAALNGTAGDVPQDEHTKAWEMVRKAFARERLDLPTVFEIERYATFVLSLTHPSVGEPGEVLNFPRDPSPGPMTA
jgi:hypothetical protein